MSNKDIKKGIAIQAEADAKKVEKLSAGLKAHKEVLVSLESGQDEIRDSMGIVLNDMSAEETKTLFNLRFKKTPKQLDDTEKRVLCACVYTLLSHYGQNSQAQSEFYANLENYLEVSERKDDFDFENLNNIDSHTDRLAILKTLCSFLFLNSESFAFLNNTDTFSWLYSFASLTDIRDACNIIKSEYSILGSDGILRSYSPLLSEHIDKNEEQQALEEGKSLDSDDPFEDKYDCYNELKSLINNSLADEKAFGKGTEFTENDLNKELSRYFPNVAFEALIAVSKIEHGFLIFTTYAFYLRVDNLFKREYVCLPYKSIIAKGITTSNGKKDGTRNIIIPMIQGDENMSVVLDDRKLEEEKLRDLLVKIGESNCIIADTDRTVDVNKLPVEYHEILISIMAYILLNVSLPIIDVYIISDEWNLADKWNDIVLRIKDKDQFDNVVCAFIENIPYPSKSYTSKQVLKLMLGLISHANIITGMPSLMLIGETEELIRRLDVNNLSAEDFNRLMQQASSSFVEKSYETYITLPDKVKADTILLDNILAGDKAIITKIENSLDYKAKKALKSKSKEVAKVVADVQEKVVDGINNVTEKTKQGTKDLIKKTKIKK